MSLFMPMSNARAFGNLGKFTTVITPVEFVLHWKPRTESQDSHANDLAEDAAGVLRGTEPDVR